ncbi:MAG: SDR family oxidoreductase [Pseudomonadota bacterium]
MSVRGKTVLITGASRGIGAATARHLAEAGANVVLAARSLAALEELAAEIGAHAIACDVARFEDVAEVVDFAVSAFGRLDVLINNAGLIEPIARIEDSDPGDWGRIVDINLKGVYHGLRAALPVMVGQGEGTVINLSSGAATSALEGWSHYCTTKAAVLSLTRCADKEARGQGVRVIGLSPGTVATDMQVAIKASGINPVSQLDPSVHIPPKWVERAIAYLMGPGGDAHLGADFSLKTEEGRALVGLEAP